MRKLILLAALLVPLLTARGQVAAGKNYEFANGNWFDGRGFVRQKFYTAGGRLTTRRPARVDSVFDLAGKYVVPPFGEAHNHNVAQSSRLDALIRMYLEAGIFYVKNPNSLPRATTPLVGKINTPQSIDVVFSRGGLTSSGGHPVGLVERNLARGVFKKEDGEGAFYFVIDTRADLDRKWDTIVAGRPDFIKTYLLYSEEYAKRKDADAYFDWRGLDPALLPEIVRRAHRAGLRVSTHVETAADFHSALVAGVDEINHLPGFRPEKNDPANYQNLPRYEISDADARLAARHGVFVVTTVGEVLEVISKIDAGGPQAAMAQAVRRLIARNLQTLAKHGVRIAVGSDRFPQTSLPEALSLYELKAFDNLTLLKMWCENTAQTIFPKRKIGRLRDGYEASFLVLSGDPLQDFLNVKRIEMRVKQGELLSLPAPPKP
ncbi:MAG TPA: amidohydrolase family protein [Pyrinomonadaceae bacterium]|nr:amidohydrolase family protein [Pyrinomonadaceae bacterium]